MQIKSRLPWPGIIATAGRMGRGGPDFHSTQWRGASMVNRVPVSARRGAACRRRRALGAVVTGLAALAAVRAAGQDIERAPINYSTATPRNAVKRLEERLAAGKTKLDFEPEH